MTYFTGIGSHNFRLQLDLIFLKIHFAKYFEN